MAFLVTDQTLKGTVCFMGSQSCSFCRCSVSLAHNKTALYFLRLRFFKFHMQSDQTQRLWTMIKYNKTRKGLRLSICNIIFFLTFFYALFLLKRLATKSCCNCYRLYRDNVYFVMDFDPITKAINASPWKKATKTINSFHYIQQFPISKSSKQYFFPIQSDLFVLTSKVV